jgi:RNA polymerase sigma-70 factor, ECF subfamily
VSGLDLARAYEDHLDDVYGFLRYRLARPQDAEDMSQAVFERAARARERFDPARASPKTWLLTIARNLLIDHFRSSAGKIDVELSDLDATHAHHDDVDLGISPQLASALQKLRVRDREVLALRFGADLPAEDIATITGLRSANVHQILSRSLRRLRVELEANGVSSASGRDGPDARDAERRDGQQQQT